MRQGKGWRASCVKCLLLETLTRSFSVECWSVEARLLWVAGRMGVEWTQRYSISRRLITKERRESGVHLKRGMGSQENCFGFLGFLEGHERKERVLMLIGSFHKGEI